MQLGINLNQVKQSGLLKAAKRLQEIGRFQSSEYLIKSLILDNMNETECDLTLELARKNVDIESMLQATGAKLNAIERQPDNASRRRKIENLKGTDLYALKILGELSQIRQQPIERIEGRLLYILHHSLPYISNGYATRGHGLAQGMKRSGIDLHCLTRPGFPIDIVSNLAAVPESDTVDEIKYNRQLSPLRNGRNRSRKYILDAADAIEKYIRDLKPQAVLVASNYIVAMPALLAAYRCAVPIAYEVRGFWEITALSNGRYSEQDIDYKLTSLIESKIASVCDHVFTLSKPMRVELITRGVADANITLLQNSCNPEQFKRIDKNMDLAARWNVPSDVPVIGYIGSFVQYEGLDDLVTACANLRDKGSTFRLILVGGERGNGEGDGPVTETIKRIALNRNFSDWLIMPGRVPHSEVEQWYSLIDIAPFPRKPQPVTELVTPMKPLEAMAMGKAVVMSSVGAMAEMVQDGETGLVFTKGDVAHLTEILMDLVGDKQKRERLGAQARRFVQSERTWDRMGRRVKDWLENN